MKRTPMVRSGFLRTRNPNRPPKDVPVVDHVLATTDVVAQISQSVSIKPLVRGTYSGGTTGPAVPKFDYVRSPALLKACREIPCQHCGNQDGTVAAAHSNQGRHGKAKSLKASDQFVASLCFQCHGALDQGAHESRDVRVMLWASAHARTVRELLKRGLWPADVPVPDIRMFN